MALDVPVVVDGAGVCLGVIVPIGSRLGCFGFDAGLIRHDRSAVVAAVGQVVACATVVAEVGERQIAPALGAALGVGGVHCLIAFLLAFSRITPATSGRFCLTHCHAYCFRSTEIELFLAVVSLLVASDR